MPLLASAVIGDDKVTFALAGLQIFEQNKMAASRLPALLLMPTVARRQCHLFRNTHGTDLDLCFHAPEPHTALTSTCVPATVAAAAAAAATDCQVFNETRDTALDHVRQRSSSMWLHFPHVELLFLLFAYEGAVAAQVGPRQLQ